MNMREDHDYGKPRDERELARFADTLSKAFAFSASEAPKWFERIGRDNLRLLREHGQPVGGLALIPMGQWFGGRSVAMGGVAAVGIDPELRGRGLAKKLMIAALHEMRGRSLAISTLYPATQALYRSVGYEQAGARFEVRIPCASIAMNERELPLATIDSVDGDALRAAYRAQAERSPGWLDRSEYVWRRVRDWKSETRRGYVAGADGAIDGYVFQAERPNPNGRYDLFVSDFVARTPQAARRIFTFFADHRSLARNVLWFGGPADPALALLEEQSYKLTLAHHWMVRVLDVDAALESRGYAPILDCELHFDVRDDLFPENQGPRVLQIADGSARVRVGGSGRLALDVRGLAALYTGHLSADGLVAAGLAEGPASERALASAIFAGPTPAMPDMF